MALHGSSSRGLSRQAYLLQWAYKAATHPQAALEHMLLLGYRGEPSALFSVSAPRRQERKPEAAKRGTFQVRGTSSEAQTMHLWISENTREGSLQSHLLLPCRLQCADDDCILEWGLRSQ